MKTEAKKRYYKLPQHDKIDRVIVDESETMGPITVLTKMSLSDMDKQIELEAELTGWPYGKPKFFTIDKYKSEIIFHPIPDKSYPIEVILWQRLVH